MSNEDDSELSDVDYLLDLSDRLHRIPVMFNVDGYDYDRLRQLAAKLRDDFRDLA